MFIFALAFTETPTCLQVQWMRKRERGGEETERPRETVRKWDRMSDRNGRSGGQAKKEDRKRQQAQAKRERESLYLRVNNKIDDRLYRYVCQYIRPYLCISIYSPCKCED